MVFYISHTSELSELRHHLPSLSLSPPPHLLISDASHVSHHLDTPEFTRHQQGEKKWPFGRTASVCKSVSKRT